MVIIQYGPDDNQWYIPQDTDDELLWMHCIGQKKGPCKGVDQETFYNTVRPLLRSHGVQQCTIVSHKES